MKNKFTVESIWWRNVPPGEFYNIERFHQIQGGGGSLYIEIPSSMVPETLEFLGMANTDVAAFPVTTIQAGVIGSPEITGPIEFHSKSGGRMRIARQNRQQPNSQRHPAWTSDRGFPVAPNNVRNKNEALPYFPEGGLRIYIAKTTEGDFYAGFTEGFPPSSISENDSWSKLYTQGKAVGGVIHAE